MGHRGLAPLRPPGALAGAGQVEQGKPLRPSWNARLGAERGKPPRPNLASWQERRVGGVGVGVGAAIFPGPWVGSVVNPPLGGWQVSGQLASVEEIFKKGRPAAWGSRALRWGDGTGREL